MTANLEFGHVPLRVVVCWSSDNSVLSFVGSLGIRHVDVEFDLQEFHVLTPFDLGVDFNTRGLTSIGAWRLMVDFSQLCSLMIVLVTMLALYGPLLSDGRNSTWQFLSGIEMVYLDIPSLTIQRLIIE